MARIYCRSIALIALALLAVAGVAHPARAGAPAALARDINQTRPLYPHALNPRQLTAAVGRLFFTAEDALHGRELWASDGTSDGTRLVRDLTPGGDSTSIEEMAAVGRGLYFTSGGLLWRSDGSAAGTSRVGAVSEVRQLTALGGQLLFTALGPGDDFGIWRADGSPGGTARVVSASGDTIGSPMLLPIVGSRLFFMFDDRQRGNELWVTSGTAATTALVKSIIPGGDTYSRVGRPSLAVIDQTLYFFSKARLWKSDGTPGGTQPVAPDIFDIREMVSAEGTLFFSHVRQIEPGARVMELWKSAGSAGTTVLVRSFALGADGTSIPHDLRAVGSRVLFLGPGLVAWASDGTAQNTGPITGVIGDWQHWGAAQLGGALYFPGIVQDDAELWRSDGTAGGATMVMNLNPDGSSAPYAIVTMGGSLYFAAYDRPGSAASLWRSDGTAAGTTLLLGGVSLLYLPLAGR